jgi:hypothetical protein
VVHAALDRDGKRLVWRVHVYATQFRFGCVPAPVCVSTFSPHALASIDDATGRVVSFEWATAGGVRPRLSLARAAAIAADAAAPSFPGVVLGESRVELVVERIQLSHIGKDTVWVAHLPAPALTPVACVPTATRHCGMPSFLSPPTEARITIDDATGRVLSVGLLSSDLPLCKKGQISTAVKPCATI